MVYQTAQSTSRASSVPSSKIFMPALEKSDSIKSTRQLQTTNASNIFHQR